MTRSVVYQGSSPNNGLYNPQDWLPEQHNWTKFLYAPSHEERSRALPDIDGDPPPSVNALSRLGKIPGSSQVRRGGGRDRHVIYSLKRTGGG